MAFSHGWKTNRATHVATVLALLLSLLVGSGRAGGSPAMAQGASRQAQGRTVTFTGREFVRNGRFGVKWDDWAWMDILSISFRDLEGYSANPVLALEGTQNGYDPNTGIYVNWVRQELFLPNTVTAGTFAVDYRLATDTNPGAGGLLVARLLGADPATNQLELIAEWAVTGPNWITQDTGWQRFQQALTAKQVQDLQRVHQEGKRVYLILLLGLGDPIAFDLYLDNVSLKLDGQWTYPDLGGAIAFASVDGEGNTTVNWMRPDGSDRRTLWTYPASAQVKKLFNLAWKPDGSEIAFASAHEFGYSNFQTDIYSVRLRDGYVRRLTNAPAHSEIQAGSYGKGTVTGRIRNNFGLVTTFLVYIQGADAPISLSPGGSGDVTSFTVPNVADLGPGKNQYMAFIWSGRVDSNGDGIPDKNCATSISPALGTLIDVRAGQTIDIGEVNFNGDSSCPAWEAAEPTWKPDGSKVGFIIDGAPAAVDLAQNLAMVPSLFNPASPVQRFDWQPAGSGCELAYLPLSGIYCTTEGGGKGTLVYNPGSTFVDPEDMDWLPDGSGFVFTDGVDIYRFTLADKRTTKIVDFDLSHPDTSILFLGEPLRRIRVGPQGRYAIFERRGPDSYTQRTLWLIDLERPTDLWPLTEDGTGFYPDWLHREPQVGDPTPTPTPTPSTPRARIYLPFTQR